jgi:hypothetical protein
MPDKLVPFRDVRLVFEKVALTDDQISELGRNKHVKLLEHAAAFAEHQFGKRVEGKASYGRDDGACIDAREVEITILCAIYTKLGDHFSSPDNGDIDNCWMNAIAYYQKVLTVLEPLDITDKFK